MIRTFEYTKYPIVEIVNELIMDCVKRGASDIHFDPTEGPLKVRIRIDGNLLNYTEVPVEYMRNLITRIKIFSGMNITESRLPQDGAIKTELNNMSIDLRVSALPTNEGEKIVIRILDYTMSAQGLESLDFSPKNYEKMIYAINQPNGIILTTGATGSGKSTTVYSILQRLNTEERNIISVEDPVEMNIEGINQVQVNSDIGLDFGNVLRSILRQDPNIIMIGEMRDTETAKIAVRASITGHLVLSTLHTNDALSTIERLLDMEVERYLLATSLLALVAQKLARRLCPKCKKLKTTNDYERNLLKLVLEKDIEQIYVPGEGCEDCRQGYRGRIAIHEVLIINQAIRDAIANRVDKATLRSLVYHSDVTNMLADGLQKVEQGLTSIEEIIKIIELDDDSETSQSINRLQQAIYDSRHSDKELALNSIVLDPAAASNQNIVKPTAVTSAIPEANPSIEINTNQTTPPILEPTITPPVTNVVTPETVSLNTEMLDLGVNINPEPIIETL